MELKFKDGHCMTLPGEGSHKRYSDLSQLEEMSKELKIDQAAVELAYRYGFHCYVFVMVISSHKLIIFLGLPSLSAQQRTNMRISPKTYVAINICL